MIRFCRKEDLKSIMVLEKECFLDEAYSLALMREYLESKDDNIFTIRIHLGEPIGYLIAERLDDEKSLWEIVSLAVLPRYQNQGIGTQLMKHVLKMLRKQEIQYVTLQVDKINQKAKRLYTKLGFKVCDPREEDTEDDLENKDRMILELEKVIRGKK